MIVCLLLERSSVRSCRQQPRIIAQMKSSVTFTDARGAVPTFYLLPVPTFVINFMQRSATSETPVNPKNAETSRILTKGRCPPGMPSLTEACVVKITRRWTKTLYYDLSCGTDTGCQGAYLCDNVTSYFNWRQTLSLPQVFCWLDRWRWTQHSFCSSQKSVLRTGVFQRDCSRTSAHLTPNVISDCVGQNTNGGINHPCFSNRSSPHVKASVEWALLTDVTVQKL